MILLNLASQVSRITGMSHWYPTMFLISISFVKFRKIVTVSWGCFKDQMRCCMWKPFPKYRRKVNVFIIIFSLRIIISL
jgi:hypothetical protein